MIRLSSGLRRSVVTNYGLGSMLNGGRIDIYAGPQPISADIGVVAAPIAVITQDGLLDSPDGGLLLAQGAVAGTLTHHGLWLMTGIAVGTAAWWRFVGDPEDMGSLDSSSDVRLDGAIGEGFEASGLPTIIPEAVIEIQRFLLTLPANN